MMGDELMVGLLGAAATVIVALVGAVTKLARDARREPATSHDSYLEADRAAATNLKRDVQDVQDEVCQFHRRLERHMEETNKVTQQQTVVLTEIKGILDNRLPRTNPRGGR